MVRLKRIGILVVVLILGFASNTVLGMVPPPASHLFLFGEEAGVGIGIETPGSIPNVSKQVYAISQGRSRLFTPSQVNQVGLKDLLQINLEIDPLQKEPEQTFLLLLVDTSWSMTNRCEDGTELKEGCRSKMEAAQEGLLAFLDKLESINRTREPGKKIKVALLRYDTFVGYYSGEWKETYDNSDWVREVNFTTNSNLLRSQVRVIAEDRIAQSYCHRTNMGWALSEGLKLFKTRLSNQSGKKVILNFTDGRQSSENIFYLVNPAPGQEQACYLYRNDPSKACTEEWDLKKYLDDPSYDPRAACDTYHPPANNIALINELKSNGIAIYNIGYGEDADGSPPRSSKAVKLIDERFNCPSSVCPGSVDGRGGDRGASLEVREKSGIEYTLAKTDLPLPSLRFNILNGLSFETGGMYYYIPAGSSSIDRIFENILEALEGKAGIRVTEVFSPQLLEYQRVRAFVGGAEVVPNEVRLDQNQLVITFAENTIMEKLSLQIFFRVKSTASGFGCLDCSISKVEWTATQSDGTEKVLAEQQLPQYQLAIRSAVGGIGDVYLQNQDIPVQADLVVLSPEGRFTLPRGNWAVLRDYSFSDESLSSTARFQRELGALLDYFVAEKPEGVKIVDNLANTELKEGHLYLVDARSSAQQGQLLELRLDNTSASALCEKSFGVLVWGGNLVLPSNVDCVRGVLIALPFNGQGGTVKVEGSVEVVGTVVGKRIEGNFVLRQRSSELFWRKIPGLGPVLEKVYQFFHP